MHPMYRRHSVAILADMWPIAHPTRITAPACAPRLVCQTGECHGGFGQVSTTSAHTLSGRAIPLAPADAPADMCRPARAEGVPGCARTRPRRCGMGLPLACADAANRPGKSWSGASRPVDGALRTG
ncbi:hypothetical protein GCM10023336_27140 [Streptomyces similanensis]|uniref:Uncharacterized protein n=1 Tax=Streptomyces similanensis TaxID=1274988 RepID=A0ABP9KB84_9ACTN